MKQKIYLIVVLITTTLLINSCKKSDPLPVAKFSYTGAGNKAPATVTFINESKDAISFLWDFGDNTTSTLKDPQHIFSIGGTYNVKLTATGDGGIDNITKTITIDNSGVKLKADFRYSGNNKMAPCEVTFTDSSIGATYWKWNFGDGHNIFAQNPAHAYAAGGSYAVTMVASNGAGDKDSITKTVTVLPAPTVCKITSISILKCSLLNPSGIAWDTLSAPDFYVNIENNAGTIFYNGSANFNNNLDTFPQTWNLSPSSDITSATWNTNYKIHIWDKDSPDPDDNVAYCLLKLSDYATVTDHYPTQVTLVNGINKIKLTLLWQ